MDAKPGMRVVYISYGVSGPAREIVRFFDVNLVGLNDNFQVGRVTKYAQDLGPQDQVQFVKGDSMCRHIHFHCQCSEEPRACFQGTGYDLLSQSMLNAENVVIAYVDCALV